MSVKSYESLAQKRWVFCRAQRITRADNDPYLWRLILLRCPWFAIYLHVFLADDDACHHDHPWPFVSLILWGGYREWTPAKSSGAVREIGRWYRPGSVLFRAADWTHRIERGKRTPVTLVITGRRQRSWGFHTPLGWIPWRLYSAKEHCN